ncbi:MAG TPA: alpha/beta hydrolase [Ktedonobacteraceae bacterium]|jgi:pimeloyl-ACP methyl ester carboxylesterase
MSYFETRDGTRLFYRDWGTGMPVVFVSAWAFSGAMWEYQMVPLSEQGLRCIAYDRRGHGRSDDPGRGYDFDTLADDLATLLTQLDLHEVTLVGNSMGCGEVARYLSRHGTSRIARVVLTSAITPFMLRTEDNPEGAPRIFHERNLSALIADRPLYMTSGAIKYFGLGSTWPGTDVLSSAMIQWAIQLSLESSPKAVIECSRAIGETDFRPDMRACTVPTLIIHGDKDQTAPLDLCGRRTAQAITGSQLKIYEGAAHGLFLTMRDRLNSDLLAFIKG